MEEYVVCRFAQVLLSAEGLLPSVSLMLICGDLILGFSHASMQQFAKVWELFGS